jgi:hypothetical protein
VEWFATVSDEDVEKRPIAHPPVDSASWKDTARAPRIFTTIAAPSSKGKGRLGAVRLSAT